METGNEDQAAYWGQSASGQKWLTFEDQLDANHVPVLDLVLEKAALRPGMQVLDIGCGTGASVIAAAAQVGESGFVTGADISEPFMERARARAAAAGVSNVDFTVADAQSYPFKPESYDAIISRFGVMFFADPVAAFANMARALRPGGQMTFATWGPLAGNPWFSVTHKIAASRLGSPPKLGADAPGPMAFQDVERVTGLFNAAGLSVQVETHDMHLTPLGTLSDVVALSTRVGPAARIMGLFEGTEEDAAAIAEGVADAFSAHVTPDGVRLPALINLFQARRDG